MARPKTLKKPSKKRLERAARRKASRQTRRGLLFVSDGSYAAARYSSWASGINGTGGTGGGLGGSFVTTNSTNSTVTFTVPSRFVMPTSNVVIESLDEGRTWHARDSYEPAANLNGQLVIGTNPSGLAPEHMRPGSGIYSFTIVIRGATQEEALEWHAQRTRNELDQRAQALRGRQQYAQYQDQLTATEEERRRWNATYTAEVNRRAREAVEKKREAKERARQLLLSHLTTAQRQDFEAKGGFWVRSQFGNLYWVTPSAAVMFDERGVALQRYCIHAVDPEVPPDDNALLRKLLLECNEDLFLSTANPGMPSRYDLERRTETPVHFIDPGAMTPLQDYIRPVGGSGGSGGSGGNVIVASTTSVTSGNANVTINGTFTGGVVTTTLVPVAPECTAVVLAGPPECTAVVPVAPGDEFVPRESTALVTTQPMTDYQIVDNSLPNVDLVLGGVILLNVNGYVRPLCG